MQEYARRSKDPELIDHATEIRLYARRRLGELMAAQKAAGLMDIGGRPKTGLSENPVIKPITFEEAGIDKNLAHRARNEAAKSEEEFQYYLEKAKQRQRDAIEGNRTNLTGQSGGNEWFTPAEYIALARRVLGGIDLDPAPHRVAQKTIRAENFFTIEDDGLTKEWRGRVWLNPPYAQPAIGDFVEKLVSEIGAKNTSSAILLTSTDTAWFHKAAESATAVCLTRGRVRFIALDGTIGSPTQAQHFYISAMTSSVSRPCFRKPASSAAFVRRRHDRAPIAHNVRCRDSRRHRPQHCDRANRPRAESRRSASCGFLESPNSCGLGCLTIRAAKYIRTGEAMTLAGLARILKGKVVRGAVIAPLPGPTFRQVRVRLNRRMPGGFYAAPNNGGDDATVQECRSYVERRLAAANIVGGGDDDQ